MRGPDEAANPSCENPKSAFSIELTFTPDEVEKITSKLTEATKEIIDLTEKYTTMKTIIDETESSNDRLKVTILLIHVDCRMYNVHMYILYNMHISICGVFSSRM